MKKLSLYTLFVLLFPMAASAQVKNTQITIQNDADVDQNDAIVAVSWKSILKNYPQLDTLNFKVVAAVSKVALPFQLEHLGQSTIQNLLIQVSVPAKSSLKLMLLSGKASPVMPKVFARYVPERKDDFAWENDKIAFRMYGKALEKTSEDAYGIDVWVKNTNKLVVNERYKLNDYHKDHGDGLDYYKVGFTLGAGGMAPYLNDSVYYSGNYHHWKILDNGPLRTTFELGYDEWAAKDVKVKVTKTISLDAGSQLNRIASLYTFSSGNVLPVVVGLALREETNKKLLQEKKGILGYWEPEHGADGITGVGAVIPGGLSKILEKKEQVLGLTAVKNKVSFVYYAGAVWNKAGTITNETDWFNYLKNFQQKLNTPLKIKLN